MAEIRPFRALRFTEKAGDPAELICPPYDIISDEQRREYLARNANNIIRLELPREGEDPYAEAGRVLERMVAEGILKLDDKPAIYVYDIEFDLEDGTHNVYGMVARLHLEEFDKGIVLPHEETLSKAKQDRLNLMKATGCNFSDVYGLYNDGQDEGNVDDLLNIAMSEQPIICVTDEAGLTHRLWAITDEDMIAAIEKRFVDTKIYIADGHHRYETAINYRNYLREQGTPVGADSDYIMMMMVEMSHPGLVVQPTHRLLRDLESFDPAALLAACRERFEVEEGLPLDVLDDRLDYAYSEGKRAFGFYTGGDTAALLTLRDIAVMDKELPALSEASRRLDVNVLHTLILEQLLGIDKANMAQQINLTYTRSFTEAIEVVANGTFQGAFLLNPTRVSEIRDVAAAGEKMPQKSTYFYPKLTTGLTVNVLK